MGDSNQDDGVGNAAKVAVLLRDEGKVDNDPAQHAGTKFTPSLDVDFAEERKHDARVQLTANEPIVEQVTSAATGGKLTVVRVLGVLYAERADVTEGSEEVRDQDVGGHDTDKVVGDECPNNEISTAGDSSCSQKGEDEERRVPR